MTSSCSDKHLLLFLSTRERAAEQPAKANRCACKEFTRLACPSFFAKPVNLDNTVKSAPIVFSRWLGWRTRAETTLRFVLKRGAQRLSKDSFPGPLMTQARSSFGAGLC
jgi:hypothetical protein